VTKTFYDQSALVSQAVGSVRDVVLIGAVLSILVLLFFLEELRATMLTALIIPATLLITFVFMRLAGLTMNLMTLGALAVGIGLIIDDAIVVVENIVRHLALGETTAPAVDTATAEITKPMISSTLTTVVVFFPLLLLTGVTGAFFTMLAVTLIIALTVSLVLVLLVSPGLCARFLRVRAGARERGRWMARVTEFYEGVIRGGLHRRRFLPAGMVLVLVATLMLARQIGTGFMPTMDEGSFVLDYLTPPGTSLAESDRILRQIERILRETPEVVAFSRRTGTELGFAITEPNVGDFAVMLKLGPRRSTDEVMDSVREEIAAQVPGVQVDFVEVLQDLIGDLSGAPAPVEVKLFGENQRLLGTAARRLMLKLKRIRGLEDLKSSLVLSGPQLVARVNPTKAGRIGLTAEMVASQMNAAMFGDVATYLMQGDRRVGVRVRCPDRWRSDPVKLASLPVGAPGGFSVPLSAIGQITTVPGTTEVNRETQRRLVAVTARLSARDLGSVMRDVQALMRQEELPPGVTYELGGQFKSQAQSFRELLAVLVLAVLLVFGVMLFQFESFTAPLVLLLTMPLSLFGVAAGLWLTGTPLNVSSFMGAIMLVGIVGENGILLLDQLQKGAAEGMPLEEAAIRAGRIRLRPVLMTTLTAILALAPLALGIGVGADMQKPLAVAVIGGLAFSTVFTLVFAPVLYVMFRLWEAHILGPKR